MKKVTLLTLGTLLVSAVSMPALAEQKVKTKSNVKNDRVMSSDRCSISSVEGGTAVDFSWGVHQGSVSPPGGAARTSPSYLDNKGQWNMRVMVTPPPADGIPPSVTWHAINNKGTGSNNGKIEPAIMCDVDAAGSSSGQARTNLPIVTKDVDNFSCDVSGDASTPVLGVHLTVPTSSKVSVQDISFMRSVGAGPGGGPHVKRQDEVVCLTESGEASSISGLLLPAVQK